MNCQSFEAIVNELARERLSNQPLEIRDLALAHADECAACAMRLRDERALSFCLDEMAKEMKSFAASPRVEEKLLQALRQRPEVGDQRRGHRNRWLVAAAAMILIVIGIGVLRGYLVRQSPFGGGPASALVQTSPGLAPTRREDVKESSSVTTRNESTGQPKRIVKRTNHSLRPHAESNTSHEVFATATNPSANAAASEVATQFMPLNYNGPINLQDGGQLVRVELPRSAMLSLGVPVNMDRYNERVKADVFVGADGLARAIRFVQ
jgi:hypothetical protein